MSLPLSLQGGFCKRTLSAGTACCHVCRHKRTCMPCTDNCRGWNGYMLHGPATHAMCMSCGYWCRGGTLVWVHLCVQDGGPQGQMIAGLCKCVRDSPGLPSIAR